MIKRILIILFVITVFSFAEESNIAEIDLVVAVTEQNDTLIDTTAELDTNEIIDSIPEILDSTLLEKSKKVSWYFSLSPRVGVDEIQKEYTKYLKERSDSIFAQIRRQDAGFNQNWFQPASASGVSFAFETGISAKINDKSSIKAGVGYSFNQSRSVYNIENSRDSVEVLRMRSRLVNNSLWLSSDYKMTFDTSYFHIKGIDAAGFYAGGSFVLSRYFERDTIKTQQTEFAEKRRKNYDGFGGAGRAGLFAQRKIGKHSIFEYSIGYLFSATKGYEDFWSRTFYWEEDKNKSKFLSISNNFELSFSLIF